MRSLILSVAFAAGAFGLWMVTPTQTRADDFRGVAAITSATTLPSQWYGGGYYGYYPGWGGYYGYYPGWGGYYGYYPYGGFGYRSYYYPGVYGGWGYPGYYGSWGYPFYYYGPGVYWRRR